MFQNLFFLKHVVPTWWQICLRRQFVYNFFLSTTICLLFVSLFFIPLSVFYLFLCLFTFFFILLSVLYLLIVKSNNNNNNNNSNNNNDYNNNNDNNNNNQEVGRGKTMTLLGWEATSASGGEEFQGSMYVFSMYKI